MSSREENYMRNMREGESYYHLPSFMTSPTIRSHHESPYMSRFMPGFRWHPNQMYQAPQFYPSQPVPIDPKLLQYFAGMSQPPPMDHNTTIQIGINPKFQNSVDQSFNASYSSFGTPESSKHHTPPSTSHKKHNRRCNRSLRSDFNNRSFKKESPVKNDSAIGLDFDASYNELQKISLKGCEVAEDLVHHHAKRPCFKKIDLLCSRLKQDLTHNQNSVANINSQGVAWAVKDFIFAFSRIVNAWVIMRGYIYNKSNEMDRIKRSFDPKLQEDFKAWQEATIKLNQSIMNSFVNLDDLSQNQRGANRDLCKSNGETKKVCRDLNSQMFDRAAIEASEEIQLEHSKNGTYFKSAVYHPVMKNKEESELYRVFNDDLDDSFCLGSESFITSTPKKTDANGMPTSPFQMKLDLIEEFDIFGIKEMSYDANAVPTIESISEKKWGKIRGAKNLLSDVLKLEKAPHFYSPVCDPSKLNLVPEGSMATNLNLIFEKFHNGEYETLAEIVQELREMTAAALLYFKCMKDNPKLKVIMQFEQELEQVISRSPQKVSRKI